MRRSARKTRWCSARPRHSGRVREPLPQPWRVFEQRLRSPALCASESHFCGILARHNFVAWDGRVLSCCHDLHAENVLGHVGEQSFMDIARAKSPVMKTGPSYRICRACNDCGRLEPAAVICDAPRA